MTWLRIALGLVQIIQWIIREGEKSSHVKEGERRALERALLLTRGRIKQALEARKSRADADSNVSDTVRLPDDGFRRD